MAFRRRRLQVELAIKRAPLEERKKKRKGEAEEAAPGAAAAADADANAEDGNAAHAAPKQLAAKQAQPRPAPAPAAAPAASRPRAAADAAATAEKHKLLRAVAVGNLTPPAIGQAVALARKAGAVEEVMNPAPPEVLREAKLEADGCTGAVVVVIYKTVG